MRRPGVLRAGAVWWNRWASIRPASWLVTSASTPGISECGRCLRSMPVHDFHDFTGRHPRGFTGRCLPTTGGTPVGSIFGRPRATAAAGCHPCPRTPRPRRDRFEPVSVDACPRTRGVGDWVGPRSANATARAGVLPMSPNALRAGPVWGPWGPCRAGRGRCPRSMPVPDCPPDCPRLMPVHNRRQAIWTGLGPPGAAAAGCHPCARSGPP